MQDENEIRRRFAEKQNLERTAREAELVCQAESLPRINIYDFEDVYPSKEINADRRETEEIKKIIEEEQKKLPKAEQQENAARKIVSEAMGIIIAEGGELHHWFGPKARVTRASEYDGHKDIDMVVEFDIGDEDEPRRFALVIDATMSADPSILEEKIEKNFKKLADRKNRTKVKYFQSAVTEYKGSLDQIVPAVAGLGGDNAYQLIELFAQVIKLKKAPSSSESSRKVLEEKTNEIKKHPCQNIFLMEILTQLNAYSAVLDPGNRQDALLLDNIEKIIEIIEAIIFSNKEIDSTELEENDPVYNGIKKKIGRITIPK